MPGSGTFLPFPERQKEACRNAPENQPSLRSLELLKAGLRLECVEVPPLDQLTTTLRLTVTLKNLVHARGRKRHWVCFA